MDKKFLEKLFSNERMQRYFNAYPANEAKAILHYQCNIVLSEAIYPCLSVLEVALRNAVNKSLINKFGVADWYSHFSTTPGLGKLMKEITSAQNQIAKRREIVTPAKIVAELTLGFWVRLFNAEFERILWKELRLAFPYLPKAQKQRHKVSAPLNNFRNFRNRVFHNEPICWNLSHLIIVHQELLQVMSWINKDLPAWIQSTDRFPMVINDVGSKLIP